MDLYSKYKKLLFTLAYQLTGSVADAEDAVQDVFVKYYSLDSEGIEEPKAYLCKMVTNQCLDLLKSARKRREQYFGSWLPEPVLSSDYGEDLINSVLQNELLSYGMLVLLERLSPAERVVFVLREALSCEYSDISRLVSKSEVSCRKLMSRSRAKMGIAEEKPVMSTYEGDYWIKQFVKALENGNIEEILSLLAEDVTLVSDGGGKVSAAAKPIISRDYVTKFLLGLMRQIPQYKEGIQIELTPLNGQTGIIVRSGNVINTAILIHVDFDVIKYLYFVRNPEKLTHL